MPTKHVRETVWEPPSPHYLKERARKGWTLVALEWEREMDLDEVKSARLNPDVPYGLKVSDNCLTLE